MKLTKMPLPYPERSVLNTQVAFDDGVRVFTVFTTWLQKGDGYADFYETMIRLDSPYEWLDFQKRTTLRDQSITHHCDAIAHLIALEQGTNTADFDTYTATPEALAVLMDWIEENREAEEAP